MEMRKDEKEPIIVYWDGKCPLCTEIKSRFIGFDFNHRLVFVDFRDPDAAQSAQPRFTPRELAEEMRVKMPNGSWRTGFFGWAEVLTAMPYLTWLGAIMKNWAFAEIGPKVYRWAADNRFAISRVLHLPEPCSPDGTCRIGAA